MQAKFLQVTVAGHSQGQWLIGCKRNSVVYEMQEPLVCLQSFDLAEYHHVDMATFFHVKLLSLAVT